MNFTLSGVLYLIGAYQIRRIIGSDWHGMFVVIRAEDWDILSVHPTRHKALERALDYDSGITEPPRPKAERLAQLADVPTEALIAARDGLPSREWRAIKDIREALATR